MTSRRVKTIDYMKMDTGEDLELGLEGTLAKFRETCRSTASSPLVCSIVTSMPFMYDSKPHTDTPVHDFSSLYTELLRWQKYRQGAVRTIASPTLTADWLRNNGTFRPVIVTSFPINPGVVGLPEASQLISQLLVDNPELRGCTISTWDVASQSPGPQWTMEQWNIYWMKRTGQGGHVRGEGDEAGQLQLIESVTLADVRRLLAAPRIKLWSKGRLNFVVDSPEAIQANSLAGSDQSTNYVGMYPSKSFINYKPALSGASLWLRLDSGSVTLSLIPPTPENLSAYAAWARDPRQQGTNLAARCEGVARADLSPGDLLLLPPGWCYAVAVTSDAFIEYGTFLRADSLAIHLDIIRIEEFLLALHVGNGIWKALRETESIERRAAKQIIWQVAARYAQFLGEKAAARDPTINDKVTVRANEMREEDRAVAANGAAFRERVSIKRNALKLQLGGTRRPQPGTRDRREAAQRAKRRRHSDHAFIASDSESDSQKKESGGSEERDWNPGVQIKGRGSESEDDDLDDVGYILGDDEELASSRRGLRQHASQQAAVKGVGTSTRFGGSMPAKLASMLHGDDDDDLGEGESPVRKGAELEWDDGDCLDALPTMKLKLKLGSVGGPAKSPNPLVTSHASDRNVNDQRTATKLKLKLVSRVDGAGARNQPPSIADWAGAPLPDELSEDEEQGLAALIVSLRQWLRHPDVGENLVPMNRVHAPWEVVARLDLAMRALHLSREPPPCADLGPDEEHVYLDGFEVMSPSRSPAAAAAAAAAGEEDGDETAPDDGAGQLEFRHVGESVGQKARLPPQAPKRRAPSSFATASNRAFKKLSTKDRLKKKLGL